MTVQLYEGCWGVTRGGEKRGPMVPNLVTPDQIGAWTDNGLVALCGQSRPFWYDNGEYWPGKPSQRNIIAVFATEAEADAYLAQESHKPIGQIVREEYDRLRAKDLSGVKHAVNAPSFTFAPAPKPVTWPERRWEAMLALAGGLAASMATVGKRPGETQAQADARWCREHADALLLAAADKVEAGNG